MTSRIATFSTVVVLALLTGCGGNGASPDGGDAGVSCSSLDQTRPLVQLTGGDLRALCDCSAAFGGGYGQSKSCDGGIVVKTPTDQASCVAGLAAAKSTCAATIADALNCASQTQQCDLTGSACQALAACYQADGGP